MSTSTDALRVRLFDRTPLLGAGRRRQAAEALVALDDTQAAGPLAEALVASEDEAVLALASDRLAQLIEPAGVDAVCALWARTRHPRLAALIAENGWVAREPYDARVLGMLAAGGGPALYNALPELVPALVAATEDADPAIAEAAWDALTGLARQDAKEVLCDLVIDQGDARAARAVREGGHQPEGLTRAALVLMLSGQEAAYRAMDPQGSILGSWLRTASPERRLELAERARAAKLRPWAQAIMARPADDRLPAEWDALLLVLAEHRAPDAIWRQVPIAPLPTGVAYMKYLRSLGWAPEPTAPSAGLYHKLAGLLGRCVGDPEAIALRVREQPVFAGPAGSATCVALSPDWRYAAIGGDDNHLRLVSLPDGQPGPQLDELPGWTRALSFGASGRYLAVATMKHQTRVFRLPDGLPVAYLDTRDVVTIALRTDGRLLASAAGQRIDLWDVEAATVVKSLPAHGRLVKGLTIGARGCTLASWGVDGAVRVWTLPDGQPIGTIEGDATSISAVALSADETMMAVAGGDHVVRVYALPDGEILAELPGDDQPVRAIAFRPDGAAIAVGAHSHRVRLFSLPAGEALGIADGYAGAHNLAWNSLGQLLAAAGEGKRSVRIWHPAAPPLTNDTVIAARPEEIAWAQRLHKDATLSREDRAWLTYWGTLVLAARGSLPAAPAPDVPPPSGDDPHPWEGPEPSASAPA